MDNACGSLPLEAVPDAREKNTRKKGIQFGGARGTRKWCQNRQQLGKRVFQIAVIRVLAMRLYVGRVGNLRQRVL